jgi:tetratricopeptide (TPR) repeat protein
MRKSIVFQVVLVFVLALIAGACKQTGVKKVEPDKQVTDTISHQLDDLNRKVLADSTNPDNYYQRALYYIDDKNVNKALYDIGRAIQLNGKNSDYFVALADIYLQMNRIPNCLESLDKAEELNPENSKAQLKLAEVYLILRDYQNVFNYTKKVLDRDQINPVAFFIRGYAYMEQGDTTLAVKSFQNAADQDQNYYEAYVQLGILYSVKKNPLATAYLETATRIRPNKPDAYYLLGMAYQEQEVIPKAMETYERLLVIDPDYKEAHYNLGYINLVYVHDFQKAIQYFDKAISLDPNYTDAYFNRGYSYELAGDNISARKDYQKALEITPNYERAISGLNRLDEGK